MGKNPNQKLKILFLMKLLLEKTDQEHTVTINELIKQLDGYGVSAERKSLYNDLDQLDKFGINVETKKTKTTSYYIANRFFELPELKLLVDAVQCSKFFTYKKSNQLIKKIESLASCHQAKQLHRQVYVENRVKTVNEEIYYNVDTLHIAIAENKQVSFRYFDYNVDKKKTYRKDGQNYLVSPYALSWDDENYYLVVFSDKYNKFANYRVDRMSDIKIVDQPRVKLPENERFNIAEYSKKVFNMFGGDEENVTLKFDNTLVNAVIDRFGADVLLNKIDENSFSASLDVAVSATFFAWVTKFGSKLKILSPEVVVDNYKSFLLEILQQY